MRSPASLAVCLVLACAPNDGGKPVDAPAAAPAPAQAEPVAKGAGPAAPSGEPKPSDAKAPQPTTDPAPAKAPQALPPRTVEQCAKLIEAGLDARIVEEEEENWGVIKSVKAVGSAKFGAADAHAFVAVARFDVEVLERREYLAVSLPGAQGWMTAAFVLGDVETEPGMESTLKVEALKNFRVEHGVVRGDISVVYGGAEFDTCDDCQGRRQYAEVRETYTLFCRDEEVCVLAPLAREIVAPSYDVSDKGNKGPGSDEPEDPFAIEWKLLDKKFVQYKATTGRPPDELAELPGAPNKVELLDLPGGPEFVLEPEA